MKLEKEKIHENFYKIWQIKVFCFCLSYIESIRKSFCHSDRSFLWEKNCLKNEILHTNSCYRKEKKNMISQKYRCSTKKVHLFIIDSVPLNLFNAFFSLYATADILAFNLVQCIVKYLTLKIDSILNSFFSPSYSGKYYAFGWVQCIVRHPVLKTASIINIFWISIFLVEYRHFWQTCLMNVNQ